jgi:aryl-alcohol dehydrogenase-like predicted oxidoreductase
MNKRPIGSAGLLTAPLIFGGNVFGWTIDEATSFALLDAFVDQGFNVVDTADVYSAWVEGHTGGESETIIGKWLKRSGKRDKILIATKVGQDMGAAGKGLGKAHIVRSIEASLRRLNTDYIDLYQSHRDDQEVPLEETLEAYASLIQAGKIRAVGASNYEAPRLAQALRTSDARGIPRYVCLQPHYNLAYRSRFEDALQKLCIDEGVAVIPYYVLAGGFLTGKYRSMADIAGKPRDFYVKKYATERCFDILKAIDIVAARFDATPAQISVAWALAQPGITAPIVSATNLHQWNEIAKSVEIKLDAEAFALLDRANAAA